MCCNLRLQVIVISVICLMITGLAYWGSIYPRMFDGFTYVLYHNFTRTYFLCLYWLLSGMTCLAGAIENKRCLLIPFMIGMCQIILGCVIWLIITMYCWVFGRHLEGATPNITALVFLIYISIILTPSIYILVIVVKFYKELASGTAAGQNDGGSTTVLCFPSRAPRVDGLRMT